jgi:hypothetical protein
MNKYLNNGQLNCPAKAKADKVIGSLSIPRGTVLANVAFFCKTTWSIGKNLTRDVFASVRVSPIGSLS